MVNSNTAPERSRKDARHDLVSYIDELKSRLDIVQTAALHGISVNDHGQACCFNGHDQKTPSLKFYDDTQTYHCFGCNAHGDVISLVQQQDGCSFTEALNALAREAGMPTMEFRNGSHPERYAAVSDCLNSAADIYHGWLAQEETYLGSRGISYETAQRFRIGRTRGRDDLRQGLEQRNITANTILCSGLVKPDGTDFFQDHIVVPIMNSGRVVDFYGRSLHCQNGSRHWRLPNNRLLVGHGLFNWNPRAEEMILGEGIFDCLALIEKGFPYAVATFGTQGLSGHFSSMLSKSRIRRVFMCYDGDASGRSAALRDGFALEDTEKEVRLVLLPDDTDPNQYLQEHPRDDFQGFLDSALSPFDYQLDQISAIEDRDELLKRIRDDLLPRVKQADPIMQPDLIKRINGRLDVPVRALNEQLKRVSDDRAEKPLHVEVGGLHTINPALDLVYGTMILMAPKRVLDTESQAPCWENTVITSTRDRFVLTNQELLKRGWYAPALERTDIRVADERYSAQAINSFLEGSSSCDLRKTFTEIRDVIRRYIDFSDFKTYDYLACWIIGTYFFPVFSHYPYVHFTGPKGSGKSQCLHVLRCLCHNAKIAGSMTLAVQFRLIGALQPTLLFDEMENLGQTQHTELHRMLKYGFERNGPEVWRMETAGNRMEMNSWSVYCPRAFASIEGMEDVIASRSVQIIMERSFKEDIKNRTVNCDEQIWQDLRDQLFMVTLQEGPRIKEIYESIEKPLRMNFSGRDWDIFKGIVAIAQAVGRDVLHVLVDFASDTHESKAARDQDNSPDIIILNYLAEVVTESGWYELGTLHNGLIVKATAQGLDLQGTMTRERFGKRLASLKVYEKRNRATRSGEKIMEYWMEPGIISKKLANHLQG